MRAISATLTAAFRADGLSTILGGLFNSFPYNAYSQNTGLVSLSKVKSRYVVAAAGAILAGPTSDRFGRNCKNHTYQSERQQFRKLPIGDPPACGRLAVAACPGCGAAPGAAECRGVEE